MLHFESIWRSFVWLLIGVIFGLASILLILGSSFIFAKPLDINCVIDNNVIVFLCIALMSAAGADFLLTGNYHPGWRFAAFFGLPIPLLLLAYFLFSPNNINTPDANILIKIVWGYVILSFFYCIGLKSLLIYRERLNHKKAEYHKNLNLN